MNNRLIVKNHTRLSVYPGYILVCLMAVYIFFNAAGLFSSTKPGVADMSGIGSLKIRNAGDAYRVAEPVVARLPYESVMVLFVSSEGDVLRRSQTTRRIATDIYTPWELILGTVPKGTRRIYYIHNHPREIPVRLGWAKGDISSPRYQPDIDYLVMSPNDIRYARYWSRKAGFYGIKWEHLAVNRFGYISINGNKKGGYPSTIQSVMGKLEDGALFELGYPLAQGITWASNRLLGYQRTSQITDRLFDIGYTIAG